MQNNDTNGLLNEAESGMLIAQAQSTSGDSWRLLPYTADILPIHAALLNTGKIFFFCGSGNNPDRSNTPYDSVLWDLINGNFTHQRAPTDASGNPIDFFCAAQSFQPDGSLMIAGGTLQYDPFHGSPTAFVFNPSTQQLTQTASMNSGRWYPTLLTLGSGQIFAVSGLDVNGGLSIQPEIYSSSFATGWIAFSEPTSSIPQYAHLFLLSSGQIFYSGAYMGGNYGVYPRILTLPNSFTQAIAETPVSGLQDQDSRNQAASVLLPPAQDQKVMICGGGDGNGTATNKVDIVDLTAIQPTYTPAASLNNPRMHHSAVLLPDRTVFVCNGSQSEENTSQGNIPAEIYNPANNTWTLAATPHVQDRVYHSVALLLPDGSVVTGGGNPARTVDELRLEIYSPAYMSQTRPVIQSAPSTVGYGATITLQTPQSRNIKWVHLIKPMATTHCYDTEQRLVDLPIISNTDTSVSVTVTSNQNLAPPGYYMLFVTDNNNVPSVAQWVQLTPQANTQLQATFYVDANFAGASQSFPPGVYRADRGDLNIVDNDNISSLRVPAGLTVQVCDNSDASGLCANFGPGDYPYVGDQLNDIISYINVQQQ